MRKKKTIKNVRSDEVENFPSARVLSSPGGCPIRVSYHTVSFARYSVVVMDLNFPFFFLLLFYFSLSLLLPCPKFHLDVICGRFSLSLAKKKYILDPIFRSNILSLV